MALPHASRTISASLLAFAFAAPVFAQQDPLQSVKDLYASAAYEDALSAVVRIDAAAPNAEAEQYLPFAWSRSGGSTKPTRWSRNFSRPVPNTGRTQPTPHLASRHSSQRSGDVSVLLS